LLLHRSILVLQANIRARIVEVVIQQDGRPVADTVSFNTFHQVIFFLLGEKHSSFSNFRPWRAKE